MHSPQTPQQNRLHDLTYDTSICIQPLFVILGFSSVRRFAVRLGDPQPQDKARRMPSRVLRDSSRTATPNWRSSGWAFRSFNAFLMKSQVTFSGLGKQSSSARYANLTCIYLNELGQPSQLKKNPTSRSYLPRLGCLDPQPKPRRRLNTPGKCSPTAPHPAQQNRGAYCTPNFQPPHRTPTALSPAVCISKPSLAFPPVSPTSCFAKLTQEMGHTKHPCAHGPFLLSPAPTEVKHPHRGGADVPHTKTSTAAPKSQRDRFCSWGLSTGLHTISTGKPKHVLTSLERCCWR